MSRNAKPEEGALQDQTLRRSGVRDWSGENQAGNSEPYRRVRMDIDEPQVGGRTPVVRDVELQLGEPPTHIDRQNNGRNLGFAAPSSLGGHASVYGASGEYMRVGHVPMVHAVKAPAHPSPANVYADNLHIPSFRIGDPL